MRGEKNNFLETMDHKGYVTLVSTMGNDLTVINSARVSFNKKSNVMADRDLKLMKYLWDHEHTSPFRHCYMSFEIYAPLVVCRHWWKHTVGCYFSEAQGWNETSRRYVTEDNEFYIPKVWRKMSENKKQGSSDEAVEGNFSELLEMHINEGQKLYDYAISEGVCVEQARFFLPANSLYVRFHWTASLQAVQHFVQLRTDKTAQKEIRDYAEIVAGYVKEHFPECYKVFFE